MLRTYGEWCRAAGYAENTMTDRHELLARVEHDLGNLLRATPAQLTKWLAQGTWTPQTRATYYGHLHGYYLWALKAGHITADPMLELARPRVPTRAPRPAREEHYRQIMAEADKGLTEYIEKGLERAAENASGAGQPAEPKADAAKRTATTDGGKTSR